MSNSYQTPEGHEPTGNLSGDQVDVRRAWVLSVMQRRPDLLARLAYFRERLRRLPRAQRRWLSRRMAVPLSTAALMLALSGAPGGVMAESSATITVANNAVAIASDGTCSLSEAIENANAAGGRPHTDCVAGSPSGSDTIVLPNGGLFEVTTYNNYNDYGYNGLPEVASAIVIEGNGSTIKRTGKDEYRLISVTTSGDLTLNDVTLSGGNPGYYYGGAALVYHGKLTVTNSTITGNLAQGGGAIYALSSEVVISNSNLNANQAESGGAIASWYSKLTITDSELKNNKGPLGTGGGAIYSLGDGYYGDTSGRVIIANTVISGNSNDGGGAVTITYGKLDLTGSTITQNTTKEGSGAGLYLTGVQGTISGATISGNTATQLSGGGVAIFGGEITIEDSEISDNNSGYYGGGVYMLDANLTVSETTIGNNTAKLSGGGVMAYSGELLIENSTIAGNSTKLGGGIESRGTATVVNSTLSQNQADNGGGIANKGTLALINSTLTRNVATAGVGGGVVNSDADEGVGALTLSRSLIAGNSANSGGPQVHSSGTNSVVTANNFNLLGSSGAAGVVGFTPGANDIVPAVAVTAVLDDALAGNGGPTQTHALVPDSPALDVAPNSACELPPVNGRDQRGVARNQDADDSASDNECDLGAYELGDATSIGFKLLLPAVLRQ